MAKFIREFWLETRLGFGILFIAEATVTSYHTDGYSWLSVAMIALALWMLRPYSTLFTKEQ